MKKTLWFVGLLIGSLVVNIPFDGLTAMAIYKSLFLAAAITISLISMKKI